MITAVYMTLAVVLAVCLCRVRNLLKHTVGKRGAISVYGQEANAGYLENGKNEYGNSWH